MFPGNKTFSGFLLKALVSCNLEALKSEKKMMTEKTYAEEVEK